MPLRVHVKAIKLLDMLLSGARGLAIVGGPLDIFMVGKVELLR
jgi:hypothetical protein